MAKTLKPFNWEEVRELLKKKDWVSLRGYNFHGAPLYDMDFRKADLSRTDFSGADMRGAVLSGAVLIGINLRGADLHGANLSGADLENADLTGANLSGADLYGADLNGAAFDGVITDEATHFWKLQCPAEGEFTGYKVAYEWCSYTPCIVELRIPAHALRSSATTEKCRCSEAVVVSISRVNGRIDGIRAAYSGFAPGFKYTVGKTVKVNDFDTNRWNECTTGIHFFMEREEAVEYAL